MGFELPVSPEEVSTIAPKPPAGDYKLRVADGENAPSIAHTNPKDPEKSPSPYIKLRFAVMETADGSETAVDPRTGDEVTVAGRTVFESLWLSSQRGPEGIMRRIKRFLLSAGQPTDITEIPTDEDRTTISEWAGLELLATLKYNDRGYLEVRDYIVE